MSFFPRPTWAQNALLLLELSRRGCKVVQLFGSRASEAEEKAMISETVAYRTGDLKSRGRAQVWIARQLSVSRTKVGRVLHGRWKPRRFNSPRVLRSHLWPSRLRRAGGREAGVETDAPAWSSSQETSLSRPNDAAYPVYATVPFMSLCL